MVQLRGGVVHHEGVHHHVRVRHGVDALPLHGAGVMQMYRGGRGDGLHQVEQVGLLFLHVLQVDGEQRWPVLRWRALLLLLLLVVVGMMLLLKVICVLALLNLLVPRLLLLLISQELLEQQHLLVRRRLLLLLLRGFLYIRLVLGTQVA